MGLLFSYLKCNVVNGFILTVLCFNHFVCILYVNMVVPMIANLQNNWERINKFDGFDQDIARRGRLLNVLLLGMSILCLLGIIAIAVVVTMNGAWNKPGNVTTIVAAAVFLIGAIGLGYVNQSSVRRSSGRRPRAASGRRRVARPRAPVAAGWS